MGAEVIREFLVSLGYKVEGGQEAKFKNSVESATKSVVALGAAAAAASTAVSAAVIAIGKSLDSLYWQAQRTNTSVSQIRSTTYAVSQLGGSVDGARSSIEGFGRQLKWNPGFEGYIKQLGVVTRENGKLRDSTVLAREFAVTIAKLPLGVQKAHAELVGMDLPTLEALQNPEFTKNAAKHAETIRKLGVNEDEAARKSKDLVNSLTSLNDTFTALGTLLVDRLGPGLTDFFGKVDRFIQDHSETIVAVFRSLGEALSNVAAFLEKAAEWAGPLFQKFDALTKSLVGTDGLTAAFTALIGLGVAAWLAKVAASILAVGNAASVALLGGALGKFMRLFGVGGAIALGMSPTEANGGEDEAIAQRRAAGTFGPAKAGELEADAAKRQGATATAAQSNPHAAETQKDNRNWWQRTMPKALGGKDAPATAPSVQASNTNIPKEGRALLDTIASTEANSYDVMYGGKKFDSYADHPRVNVPITSGPNAGRTSSAAGRYQFLASTWDRQAKKLGLKDFSPQSQDIAAWDLAKTDYKRNTGGDLEADLKSGDPAKISAVGRALSGTWTSLPGGIEQGQGEGRMNRTYQRALERQQATEQTPQGSQPDDVVRPKSWQDREREADRQTDIGRVQAFENNLPQGDEKQEATKDQTDAKAEKSSGFKVDNRLGDNERGNAASNSLFSGQGLADQKVDGRLTKTKDPTASLFNPESPLVRAADNAAKVEGGGLGGNSSALTPPPASTAGTSITINQENHTSVTGSGDPHDTAQRIGQTQKDTNAGMVRDLKGVVR